MTDDFANDNIPQRLEARRSMPRYSPRLKALLGDAAALIRSQAEEIERLTREGGQLSANQCEGPMIGDPWGHFHCATVTRLEALLAVFLDYAQSGQPFAYPPGSLQMLEQALGQRP